MTSYVAVKDWYKRKRKKKTLEIPVHTEVLTLKTICCSEKQETSDMIDQKRPSTRTPYPANTCSNSSPYKCIHLFGLFKTLIRSCSITLKRAEEVSFMLEPCSSYSPSYSSSVHFVLSTTNSLPHHLNVAKTRKYSRKMDCRKI